jgi:hypothetical protein
MSSTLAICNPWKSNVTLDGFCEDDAVLLETRSGRESALDYAKHLNFCQRSAGRLIRYKTLDGGVALDVAIPK